MIVNNSKLDCISFLTMKITFLIMTITYKRNKSVDYEVIYHLQLLFNCLPKDPLIKRNCNTADEVKYVVTCKCYN